MARQYSIWYQKELAQRRRAREKARKQGYRKLRYSDGFTPEIEQLYNAWRVGGDLNAKKQYFSMLAKRGSGNRVKGAAKQASGRLGGLKTKLVKRKQYVKGEQHGNYGKRRAKEPVPAVAPNLTPEQALKVLIAQVERRLRDPEAYTSLTWSPDAWRPPKIPRKTRILNDRGDVLQRGVPLPGEGENTQ